LFSDLPKLCIKKKWFICKETPVDNNGFPLLQHFIDSEFSSWQEKGEKEHIWRAINAIRSSKSKQHRHPHCIYICTLGAAAQQVFDPSLSIPLATVYLGHFAEKIMGNIMRVLVPLMTIPAILMLMQLALKMGLVTLTLMKGMLTIPVIQVVLTMKQMTFTMMQVTTTMTQVMFTMTQVSLTMM